MKITKTKKVIIRRIFTVLIKTMKDYKRYLRELDEGEEEGVLCWLDEVTKIGCSPNKNTWHGCALRYAADFDLSRDADGSEISISIVIDDKLIKSIIPIRNGVAIEMGG